MVKRKMTKGKTTIYKKHITGN